MTASPTALHDPFASSLAGRRLGRYEVLARLASGGMAGVYVARAIGVAGFERLFAIKVLHPHLAHEEEFISMFLDEARLAARIRHPNVVPTIDISDTADAGYYLVMDYIEGDHLGALLQTAFKQGGRLPAPVSLRVVVDALDGLAAAHNLTDEHGRRLNLVHRDVSPHNVMVSTDGISRITDFGVAKAEVRLSTTREGQFKGKLAYMAPEHASSGEADQRSDLFSMAIILWESLTGRRLFRAENHAATLNKICLEPIPAPSEVDPALAPFDPILARGLARDPADRYQTAEEFAEAIERDAPALGGMGHPRAVAKLVRELAAEKLSSDVQLIRGGIALVASNQEPLTTPSPPMPAAPLPGVMESGPAPTDELAQEVELVDDAVVVPSEAPARRGPSGLAVVGALLLIAAALGMAVVMLDESDERVTTSPLQDTQPIAAPPPAAPEAAPATANAGTPAAANEPAPTTAASGTADPATTPEAPATAEATAPADGRSEGSATAAKVADPEARSADGDDKSADSAADKRASRRAARSPSTEAAPVPQPVAPETEAKAKPKATTKPTKPKAPSDDDLMLNPYRN